MTKGLSWLLLIIPGTFAVLSGAAISAQDKYTFAGARRARILRIQGIRRLAINRDQ
jgi:hypothetical protein